MSIKTQGSGKKEPKQIQSNDVLPLVERKIEFFKDVIQRTILHVHKNKNLNILGISDITNCVEKIGELSKKIEELNISSKPDIIISNLQLINNDLSTILKNYGTELLEDLLLVCFGNNNKVYNDETEYVKYELLKKYFRPTGYKVTSKKDDIKKDEYDAKNHLMCYDVSTSYKQFNMKVHGIKVLIHSVALKKSLLIYGIIDDVIIEFLNNKYVNDKIQHVNANIPDEPEFKADTFKRFISSLSLKDFLVLNVSQDFYNKYAGNITHNNLIKQKQISQLVKEFIADDMYSKRNTLINLLIRSNNYDNQYLAYLLYDLLSNDSNGNVDSHDQMMLFDSLPWTIKQSFKQAMKKTIQYTNELSNFDMNKIPLEQQICLLKVSDAVKEKAMVKLKEVKAKTEDSGSKARQYLDGLLKIPFGVYKREPVLNAMDQIKTYFRDLCKKYDMAKLIPELKVKDKYASVEIINYLKKITKHNVGENNESLQLEKIKEELSCGDKKTLISNIKMLDTILKKYGKKRAKYTQMNKDELSQHVIDIIDSYDNDDYEENKNIINDIYTKFGTTGLSPEINVDVERINKKMSEINQYMDYVKKTLDKVVYGHEKAKKQVERVIGQWISGDMDGCSSHILGFEGNPGIGKTTLAKGLSECLKDENGVSRPFALIALGGDSNASTLVGHSYTYVGSNYGSIVQILIDKKCMNPIILFDEVDKISKTENGREITGILTHLLDTTQNSCFQDKYFSGIDIDLSKALFILSYNDVESLDKILLDRVHRIKFDSLTIDDKIVIANNHLLPELYKQLGLEDMIQFPDDTLKFIIEEYTLEPGVRKLKEKLFEIVADINLDILRDKIGDTEFPIVISRDDVRNNYFKDKHEVKVYKIHDESKVGVINALWANQMSQGGVLPLQASFIPASKFLELTLTGSMGEVMKESISVSLTNAWNLTSPERKQYLLDKYNNPKNNGVSGIHIHCPDISTKKDGPSATTAFTILIYSLLNDIKIKNYFGITGETHFGYCLTEIGGLEEKIIHSIKSGVTEFIFPTENQKDFNKIMNKYKNNKIIEGIKFHSISHIDDALELILDK